MTESMPKPLNPVTRLAGKFGIFFRKMRFAEAPRSQALFGQACYLAGAQAAFQILAAASEKSPGEAIIIWGELQSEILGALAKPADPLIEMPPENKVVM